MTCARLYQRFIKAVLSRLEAVGNDETERVSLLIIGRRAISIDWHQVKPSRASRHINLQLTPGIKLVPSSSYPVRQTAYILKHQRATHVVTTAPANHIDTERPGRSTAYVCASSGRNCA